jgi:hypothetical protein
MSGTNNSGLNISGSLAPNVKTFSQVKTKKKANEIFNHSEKSEQLLKIFKSNLNLTTSIENIFRVI